MELIERDEQLARLDAGLARAAAGRGGLVLVSGEAGVGKTRLVRAALDRRGVTLLAAEATQEASEPYAPIAALARAHARAGVGASGGPLDGSSDSTAALADRLCTWLAELGETAPVAVFLDDLQWADAATIDLIPRLALELEHVPVLVVAAYRSDEIARGHPVRKVRVALRRAGRLDEIEVPALGPAGTAELAAQVLGGPVAPSLASVLYDRTQGLPFFVEELAAVLRAETLLEPGEDGLALASGRDVPLPDTVRDAVLLRAEQLHPDARRTLETAAVAGLQFELRLLDELGASAGLEEAVALGLVTETEPGVAAFRHTLVREAVYADTAWARRRDLHERVAAALELRGAAPHLLAEHLLAAGQRDRARAALIAAADASCAVHAYRDASESFRAALELWPQGDDEARRTVLTRLARCAERSGEQREAVRLWEALLHELDPVTEPLRVGDALRSVATAYRLLGRKEQAATARAKAAASFEAAGAFGDAAEVRLSLVWDFEAHEGDSAFDVLDDADRDAGRAARTDLAARARGLRAHLLARRGRFDEAARLAAEALELARSSGVTEAIFDAYWYVAAIGMTRADYDGAVTALEEAAELCRASGLREDEELCIACLAKILSKQGEWDRSVELAERVLAAGDGSPGVRWGALWAAGFVAVARGRSNEGRALLAELTALGRRLRFTPALVEGLQGLAVADELDGDLDSAAERNREVVDLARSPGSDLHHFAPTLRWAATFSASRGDAEQLSACADALSDIAARFGSADTLAALAHVLGEASLLAGDVDEAARQFARALELLADVDSPFEVAVTKLRAGVAFAAAGEREVGVDALVEAYRCFRRLGATPFSRRAAAALEELGEPVDRRLGRRAAGELERGGLTRRELEILRHVAVGRTNAEIAAELVLSERTVEMHVRNTLAKLDCRSRTEATARAYELGLVAGAASH
jgi:DNA-binding NarL/FixJ family response regulator